MILDSYPEYRNSEKLRRVFLYIYTYTCCSFLLGREHLCRRVLKTVSGKHHWSASHNSVGKILEIDVPVTRNSLRRFVQKLGRCSYFVFLAGDFSRIPLFFIRPSRRLDPRHTPFAVTERVQKFANDPVDLRLINFRDLTFFSYFRRRCPRPSPVARMSELFQ